MPSTGSHANGASSRRRLGSPARLPDRIVMAGIVLAPPRPRDRGVHPRAGRFPLGRAGNRPLMGHRGPSQRGKSMDKIGADVALLRARRTSEVDKGRVHIEVIGLGDFKVKRQTYPPGWRFSTDMGQAQCNDTHVGLRRSPGTCTSSSQGGEELDIRGGDVFVIPPGHDAWTDRRRGRGDGAVRRGRLGARAVRRRGSGARPRRGLKTARQRRTAPGRSSAVRGYGRDRRVRRERPSRGSASPPEPVIGREPAGAAQAKACPARGRRLPGAAGERLDLDEDPADLGDTAR